MTWRPPTSPRARIGRYPIGRAVVGVVVGAAVLVLSGSSAASAHDASGLMTIDATTVGLQTPGGDPGELTVTVRITYANDGDEAPGAVATATATEAGGAVAAPVTLADAGDGTYSGAMLVPTQGSWTVRVESTNPAASAEQTVEVTPASTTTTTGSSASSTLARMKESTSSETSDDSTTVVLVAIAVFIVAAALTTWLILRTRRSSEPNESGSEESRRRSGGGGQ